LWVIHEWKGNAREGLSREEGEEDMGT